MVHNDDLKVQCIGCKNIARWKQEFILHGHKDIVYLCEEHHFILRTKVDGNIKFDENVLEWLINQPANSHKVMKYGIYLIGKRTIGVVIKEG